MKLINYYFDIVFNKENHLTDKYFESIADVIKNLSKDAKCPQILHKFEKAYDSFEIRDSEIDFVIEKDIPYENEMEDFPILLEYLGNKFPEKDFLVTFFSHTDDLEDDTMSTTNTWTAYLCEKNMVKKIHCLEVVFDGDKDEYHKKGEIAYDIMNNISMQYKSGDVIDDYLYFIDEWDEENDYEDELLDEDYDEDSEDDNEEDFGFPFDSTRNLDLITIDNYFVMETFCAIGFYDKSTEMLYSIGRFNTTNDSGNSNSYDFIVHEKTAIEDMELMLYHFAEYEYMKSERQIDVQEYFEFNSKAALKLKLEERGISIANQLLEKLSIFDSDFPKDV